MRINATVASVQSAKPGKAYGQLAHLPLKAGEKAGVLRAAIPADIPDNAVVSIAELVFHSREAFSSPVVFTAQRQSEPWSVSKVTWNNRPAVIVGTDKNKTVASAAVGDEFRINVTDHVQAFIAGTATNRGWRIYADDTTARSIYGSTADKYKPYLNLEYLVPGDAPTELVPDGAAVSIAKPTLSFAVPDDTIAVQVQIDADADGTSVAYDTGEVAAAAGIVDLSRTDLPGGTFGGLTLGATTYWHARCKGPLGWSLWSEWATLPRIAKPTVTITSPGATTGDKTPPITWTASGQVMWHAELLKPNGKTIDDSDRTPGTATEWVPDTGLKKVGDIGRVHVRVWDNVDRVATPGDPIYAEAHFDFQLVAIGVAPGADVISARIDGASPVVRVTWDGATPDLWRITRDGEFLDLIDGDLREFFDYGARPLTQHVYQALAATDTGLVSPNGPTATVRPVPAGAWLMDPDTDERIMIGDEEVTFDMTERAVLHTPLGDGAPIRRRSGTPPPSGTVTGELHSLDEDFTASAMHATALGFKDSEQGRVYRLTIGSWNIPVTIGDLSTAPIVRDDSGRNAYSISFSWWQINDELPWDD